MINTEYKISKEALKREIKFLKKEIADIKERLFFRNLYGEDLNYYAERIFINKKKLNIVENLYKQLYPEIKGDQNE